MTDKMRSERKAIIEHQESKVDNIQNELTIQLLSFTGLTIAFGIGLMRTIQMYRNSRNRIRNLD